MRGDGLQQTYRAWVHSGDGFHASDEPTKPQLTETIKQRLADPTSKPAAVVVPTPEVTLSTRVKVGPCELPDINPRRREHLEQKERSAILHSMFAVAESRPGMTFRRYITPRSGAPLPVVHKQKLKEAAKKQRAAQVAELEEEWSTRGETVYATRLAEMEQESMAGPGGYAATGNLDEWLERERKALQAEKEKEKKQRYRHRLQAQEKLTRDKCRNKKLKQLRKEKERCRLLKLEEEAEAIDKFESERREILRRQQVATKHVQAYRAPNKTPGTSRALTETKVPAIGYNNGNMA